MVTCHVSLEVGSVLGSGRCNMSIGSVCPMDLDVAYWRTSRQKRYEHTVHEVECSGVSTFIGLPGGQTARGDPLRPKKEGKYMHLICDLLGSYLQRDLSK
jgi:hypothetical protein